MKKTILLVIDGLPGGGAERVVLTLAGAMARRGHDVTIASLHSALDYTIPEGVHYLLVEDTYRGPLRRQTEILRRARQLDRALERHYGDRTIDLAISHLPKADRIVAASRRLQEAWLCLHCAIEAGQLQHRHGLRRWIKQRQLIRTYSGRKLITVCQALQDDVLACGIRPARMQAIYNPFDIDAIRARSLEACPMDGERFLLHVGRFNVQKRHDRLFHAFRESGYDGKLVLLGQGQADEQAALAALARELGLEDRIVFAGFSANPYAWMRAADLLLLSSDYEGLSMVLLESLICGTPAVSTCCPYGPEEVLVGEYARGLCALDATDMARAIRDVLARPPADNLDAHLATFSLDHVVDTYLSLCD